MQAHGGQDLGVQIAALRQATASAVQRGTVSADSARGGQASMKARRRAVQADLHEAQGELNQGLF